MYWNGPCLQRNCFSKNYIFKGIVSQNPGMSRNYSQITVLNNLFDGSELALYLSKYPLKVISKGGFYFLIIHSKTRLSLQDTVITPKYGYHIEKLYPKPVCSHVFNSYFQSTHLTVSVGLRSVVPSFHSVTPSLRLCLHSDNPKIVSIPTNSILPDMVPSNNPVDNPSKSAIHQKTNIPPFHYSIQGVGGPIYRQDTEVPSYTVCDCHQSP